jgi:hypothetical protein
MQQGFSPAATSREKKPAMTRAKKEDWSAAAGQFGGNHRLHHQPQLFKRFPVRSSCSDMAITRMQAVGCYAWQHRLVRSG